MSEIRIMHTAFLRLLIIQDSNNSETMYSQRTKNHASFFNENLIKNMLWDQSKNASFHFSSKFSTSANCCSLGPTILYKGESEWVINRALHYPTFSLHYLNKLNSFKINFHISWHFGEEGGTFLLKYSSPGPWCSWCMVLIYIALNISWPSAQINTQKQKSEK